HEIVDAIKNALAARKRVIIEHFDLVYQKLGFNAQIIFGIGEEVRVYRPSIFGPSPLRIQQVAEENLKYRLMAHSAEDIVGKILKDVYDYEPKQLHSDVRHGFIIGFDRKPQIDLEELEQKTKEMISQDLPIAAGTGDFVMIGKDPFYCTGKRIHVKRTGAIEHFRLIKDYKFDPISGKYLMVGIVGEEPIEIFHEHAPIHVDRMHNDGAGKDDKDYR
ncbi:MAG: hypothetical protein Q8O00_09715, partial [Holophaga sp.]|nr:hypothetical protein [Holophaga sp.]